MRLAQTGTGRPLLLLHGAGVAGWMWRPVIERLSGQARVLVPDLPGHGGTAEQPYRSHRDTLDELIRLLADRTPAGAVVVGFSLGGQLAILLAAARPDLVRGVGVISAQTLRLPLPRFSLAVVAASAPLARRAWFARLQGRQLGVPDELLADYLRDSAVVTRETLVASVRENLGFRLPAGWSAYPGPAAVLAGAGERPVMLDSARASHAALPGSTLRLVPDCAHDLPWRRPALIAEQCRELLVRGGEPGDPAAE